MRHCALPEMASIRENAVVGPRWTPTTAFGQDKNMKSGIMHTNSRTLGASFVAAILLTLAACGGGGGGGGQTDGIETPSSSSSRASSAAASSAIASSAAASSAAASSAIASSAAASSAAVSSAAASSAAASSAVASSATASSAAASSIAAGPLAVITNQAVTTGDKHTCAIKADRTLMCWGSNATGLLGLNSSDISNRTNPTAVALSNLSAVAVGITHSCALTSAGAVYCWGWNYQSPIGNGVTESSAGSSTTYLAPVLANITSATAITAGKYYNCALKSDGSVWCWGFNSGSQLGSSGTPLSTPTQIGGGLSGVKAISGWSAHTCAITSSNGVICWGTDTAGELGDGNNTGYSTTTPKTVVTASGVSPPQLTNVVSIAAGHQFSCAVKSDGTVWCWGSNGYGTLGASILASGYSTFARQISSISNAVQVAAGERHACALISDGSVKCWGANPFGQIGNGTVSGDDYPGGVCGSTNSTPGSCSAPTSYSNMNLNSPPLVTTPATVNLGGRFAIAIRTGTQNSCALLSDNTVMCWGSNQYGQIGDGTTGGTPDYQTSVGGASKDTGILVRNAPTATTALAVFW